jgi:hypothetical protein
MELICQSPPKPTTMTEKEIEKLRQLVSRTDMSGKQKLDWLLKFINVREQALRIHDNFINVREQALRIHDIGSQSEKICFCGAKQKTTCRDNRAYRVCENGHEY